MISHIIITDEQQVIGHLQHIILQMKQSYQVDEQLQEHDIHLHDGYLQVYQQEALEIKPLLHNGLNLQELQVEDWILVDGEQQQVLHCNCTNTKLNPLPKITHLRTIIKFSLFIHCGFNYSIKFHKT
jgi:hypothetical protein